jgi:hypothetical protein
MTFLDDIDRTKTAIDGNQIAIRDPLGGTFDCGYAGNIEFAAQRCAMREHTTCFQHKAAQARKNRRPTRIRLTGDKNIPLADSAKLRDIINNARPAHNLARAGCKAGKPLRSFTGPRHFIVWHITAAQEFRRLKLSGFFPLRPPCHNARIRFVGGKRSIS